MYRFPVNMFSFVRNTCPSMQLLGYNVTITWITARLVLSWTTKLISKVAAPFIPTSNIQFNFLWIFANIWCKELGSGGKEDLARLYPWGLIISELSLSQAALDCMCLSILWTMEKRYFVLRERRVWKRHQREAVTAAKR